MTNSVDSAGQFALDVGKLAALKRQSREDPKAGMKAAAQQFEAVFMQMVLKSMREATPQNGPFDTEQTKVYQSLLDQQLATTLAARGAIGLAGLIEKQLDKGLTQPDADNAPAGRSTPADAPHPGGSAVDSRFALETLRNAGRQLTGAAPAAALAIDAAAAATAGSAGSTPREFVHRVWLPAWEASRQTGIPAHFLVAQAALETGWGKSEIRLPNGQPSYNLFNIKAGRSWAGATVDTLTTEYVDGVAQKQVERFRAYGSYAESFADYANLIRNSPRYSAVVGEQDAAQFARGLQEAGYATDPRYAEKLTRIIGSEALRQGLAG